MHVLLLCNDLMTTSQIESAVRAAGGNISVATTVAEPQAETAPPDVVIIDLSTAADFSDTVERLRKFTPTPRIIAFGSHVPAGKLSAAREAGCDEVFTRGQFLPNVAGLLSET